MVRQRACAYRMVSLPSSKTNSANFFILTNPWLRASARTAYVDTTICTSFKAASQIRCSLQRSTLSEPIRSLVLAAGICKDITPCCCMHKATVGARNQTSYNAETRLSISRSDAGDAYLLWRATIELGHDSKYCSALFDQRQQGINYSMMDEKRSDPNQRASKMSNSHMRLATPGIHLFSSLLSKMHNGKQ
jgi:hypothetical protein